METQDISKNLGNGDILIYQSEDENQTKIQLFGISERLNLSETPTGSKLKTEWLFGISEQPLNMAKQYTFARRRSVS